MASPKTLLLTGYGINCEEETCFAFEQAGALCEIIHVNDLIERPQVLKEAQIFVFPGGFSYGDDTGSGLALANRIKNNLLEELGAFVERDTLMLGICNGFQVMTNIGVVPGLAEPWGNVEAALDHNRTNRYQCRWVDLKVTEGTPSVFTRGIEYLHIPVAHGEGNFYAPDDILQQIEDEKCAAMRYVKPGGSKADGEFPFNPNGSLNDIAALSSKHGRIMGMMPHPERALFFTQQDMWTRDREIMKRENREISKAADGMAIFKNAVEYFS